MIYIEDHEVSEMYFIIKGVVGIGFTTLRFNNKEPYKICQKLGQGNSIGDHYVFNNQRSKYIYIAFKNVQSMALSRRYIKEHLVERFHDQVMNIKSKSSSLYNLLINTPMSNEKRQYMEQMERQTNQSFTWKPQFKNYQQYSTSHNRWRLSRSLIKNLHNTYCLEEIEYYHK